MKIDSHQHFWIYNDEEYGWIPEDNIRKDFLPANLKPILKNNGFDGSVAVQARQNEQETDWLLQLADESEIVKGVVGWIDLRADNVAERISNYKSHSKLSGFRHVVQDEPDDRFMMQPAFLNGISELAKASIPYDILIFPKHLEVSLELVQKFPNHDFVIDHIAKPDIKSGEIENWSKGIKSFKGFDNVRCKLSGMITETHFNQWEPKDFYPYLDVVFETFGPSRLMIGSDWPVCLLSGEYGPMMNIVKDYIAELSADEQADILGNVACEFYRLLKN